MNALINNTNHSSISDTAMIYDEPFDLQRFLNFDGRLQSKNSASVYGYILKKFDRICLDGAGSWQNVNQQTILDYMEYLKKSGLKNTSINSNIKALKRFYNLLIKENYVDNNPVNDIAYLKESEVAKTNKFKWLDENQLKGVFNYLKQNDTEKGLRDYAIFYFLIMTGLRNSELCNLKFKDIIYKDNKPIEIVFTGKGDKERVVEVDESIMDLVEMYRDKAGLGTDRDDYLFYTTPCNRHKERKPLTRGTLYKIINAIGKKCGLNLSVHKLRHTNLTHLVKNGAPIHRVQKHAGHSNVQTTISTYVHDDTPVLPYVNSLKNLAVGY